MSTASDRAVAPEDLPPPDNPYLYGWRFVQHTRPDGTECREQVPLTRLDVLHPREDDYVSESDLHEALRGYLTSVFRARFADDPTTLVLSDTAVYWDDLPFDNHSPDIAVIFDVKETRVEWTSFDVAEQGVRPRLIIELVSPHVRKNDVVDKVRHYHLAEVERYVIADRTRVGGDWTIKGFQYTPAGYEPLATEPNGRLWLADVGVWLGAEGPRLVCYDETGDPIGDYTAVRRRVEMEKARVDAAAARADAERARADAEAQLRAEYEARLRALEDELARLRGQNPG